LRPNTGYVRLRSSWKNPILLQHNIPFDSRLVKNIPTRYCTQVLFFFLFCIILSLPGLAQPTCTDSMELYSINPARPNLRSGNFLTELSNGNLVYAAGRSDTTTLILTKADGVFMKGKRFYLPDAGLGTIYKIAAAPGGGMVITGFFTNASFYGMFLVKINDQLDVEWAKKIHGVVERNFTTALTRDFDLYVDEESVSYLLFHSYHYSLRLEDGALLAIDPQGDIRWARSFIFSGLNSYPAMINAMTVLDNKICLFGSGLSGSQPSVAAFAFDRTNGNFLVAKRLVIDDGPVDIVGTDQPLSHSSRLAVSATGFYYTVEAKKNFPGRSHLYRLKLDNLFNPVSVLRIGNFAISAGDTKQVTIDSTGMMAFSGGGIDISKSNDCLGIVDAAGNILFQKKSKPGLFQNAQTITRLLFLENDRLQVGFGSPPAFDTLVQMNIPLFSDSLQYGCLEKDTSFFQLSTHTAQQLPIVPNTTFVSGLLAATDLPVITADLNAGKTAHCKIVSVCTGVTISGNTSFCPGTTQVFNARKNETCYKKLRWNTDTIPVTILAQTDSSITVSFDRPWTGDLVAGIGDCAVSGRLSVEAYPLATGIELGPDTILCPNSAIAISAGQGYDRYEWSDGSTAETISIDRPGKYFVTVTDRCGNRYSDTIKVTAPPALFPKLKNQRICSGDTIFFSLADGFSNYLWTPSLPRSGDVYFAAPLNTTIYTIQATGEGNCAWEDRFIVLVDKCPDEIWFPSAFTPNNDGLNDQFGPVTKARFLHYSFRVYDRWGQEIFNVSEPGIYWDGRFKKAESPAGVYAWTCTYQYRNGPVKHHKGIVTIIR
jgi:gliding motility-associated-like protein